MVVDRQDGRRLGQHVEAELDLVLFGEHDLLQHRQVRLLQVGQVLVQVLVAVERVHALVLQACLRYLNKQHQPVRGLHSTEVAYLLLTQQPWV